MTSLGAVRVPLDSLDFPHQRQISFRVRERLARIFKNLSKAGATEVQIPCTVEEARFGRILAHLGLSADQLRARRKGKDLPLVTGIRLPCLYGEYLAAAAKRSDETSLVVHLFSAELLDPLLELISAFSHEPQQSDGELYKKIVDSHRRDEVTHAVCMGSLTEPKERNMKMLLRPKNLPIVKALNSLSEIEGMMEGLQLGNFHKWLALHMDEQIIAFLQHIYVVWKEKICEGKRTIMQNIDIDSIRVLQFRMPEVCAGDADTINRLFSSGTLFPKVDASDRDMLRRNILALKGVIPSLETFQENMKFVGIGAKVLARHVVDNLPLCKSSKKRSPTIYELLSDGWVAPEVAQVEFDDHEMRDIEGPATAAHAFKQLNLVCARLFPWLQDRQPPREDWQEDNFNASVAAECVTYVLHLAFELGFRTSNVTAAQSQPSDPGLRVDPPWREMPDWRGGRPFTRTFWALRTNGFLPRLAATRRRQPNPEYVLLDMMTAFFGEHAIVLKQGSGDLEMEDYSEEPVSGQEDEQMDDRPGAPREPPGNRIRPRSRYFGSTSADRHKKPGSAAPKTARKHAPVIPRREAARSVLGRPAIARAAKKPAHRAGAVPVPGIPARFAQQVATLGREAARTDLPPVESTPGPGVAQSAEAAPIQTTGSSAPTATEIVPKDHRFEPFDPAKTPVPGGTTTTFGREAARSVFVANPKWGASIEGIRDGLAIPTTQRHNISPARRDQEPSRPTTSLVPTLDSFTSVIPPIRRMKPPIRSVNKEAADEAPGARKHLRPQFELSTIRQEMPAEPVQKKFKQRDGPPPKVGPVDKNMTSDRKKRIAARDQRKRDAIVFVAPDPMDMAEEGGPSAQPNPFPINTVQEEEEEL